MLSLKTYKSGIASTAPKAKPPEGRQAVRGLYQVRFSMSLRTVAETGTYGKLTQPMPIRQVEQIQKCPQELPIAFERTLSAQRWLTYRKAAGYRNDVANRLYLWNVSVGQAFHFPLQAFEFALRNVVNDAEVQSFGPRWYCDPISSAFLDDKQSCEIEKTVRKLRSLMDREPDVGEVVACLNFGFWTALLKPKYKRALWDVQTPNSFPYLESHATIDDAGSCADAVRGFRNRVFHHEPLIGRNLSEDYGRILRMLGWICPVTRDWVRRNASVPAVIRLRPR